MPQTVYGRKHGGKSRFVIVAPHGAGDDLKTGIIASRLSRALSGAVVINNQYKKRRNKNIVAGSKLTGDFNRLRLAKISQKYLWRRKRKAMKIFYDDVAKYCDKVKRRHKQKAVAIYVHGMKNKNVGIDLSVGLRHQGSRLFGSKYHAETGDNTGAITLKINQAKEIFRFLKKELEQAKNLKTTMGESFSGWSKWSGIQFHKHAGRNDYALQIEINQTLRASDDEINYLIKILTQALKLVF